MNRVWTPVTFSLIVLKLAKRTCSTCFPVKCWNHGIWALSTHLIVNEKSFEILFARKTIIIDRGAVHARFVSNPCKLTISADFSAHSVSELISLIIYIFRRAFSPTSSCVESFVIIVLAFETIQLIFFVYFDTPFMFASLLVFCWSKSVSTAVTI